MQLGATRLGRLGAAVASRVDPGLLLILALPWVLLASGSNWVLHYRLTRSSIDPWIYFGYFLDLPTHLQAFPGTYYGSRLSWILPGYAAYKLFPPVIATYVLHFSFYYAAVGALYLTLKDTVSGRAALLSASLMGLSGFFLLAIGWDYVDGAGIAYSLLTMLTLTYAAKRERAGMWLGLGGALFGAMIYSQLFLVAYTPAMLLYYIAANRERRRHSLVHSCLYFTAGFLAISSLLGWINRALGGDFLFFWASIRFAIELVGQPNPYKEPILTWLTRATWLILPSLVFANSIAFLVVLWKRRSDRETRFPMFFQVYYLICASTSLFVEWKGSPVLQTIYYASYLMPGIYLALGAQLAPTVDRLSSRQFRLMYCGAGTIFLATYMYWGPTSGLTLWLNAHAPWAILGFVLVGATCLIHGGHTAQIVTLSILSLCPALVNIGSELFRSGDPGGSKAGLLAIERSVRVIQSVDPSGRMFFWYRAGEPMEISYRSIASTYLWAYRVLNERFPSLEQGKDSFQTPKPNMKVVVLTNDEGAFQKAQESLGQIGLGARLIAERRIQEGPLAWNMIFIQLHGWPFVESVEITDNEWPERLQLRLESREMREVSLQRPDVHSLFRSDMDDTAEWQINRYGRSGDLTIQPSCFSATDNCGLYQSGDRRDHLAMPYMKVAAADRASVFFSIWVKPLAGSEPPKIVLQNERFETVAEAGQLLDGEDGWVLHGDWLEVQGAKELRVTITQRAGRSSLLDKAQLIEMPAGWADAPAR